MTPEILNALSVLESEPNNPDALAALAAAAEGGGNGKSDPAADRALTEARRIHRERGDAELVVRLLDLELGWQKDPARRAELLLEKGRVLSSDLWRDREAEDAFRRALELRPDDPDADQALTELTLERENASRLIDKYLAEARGATDQKLSASLHVSVAELYAKQGKPPEEVETELRSALEVDAKNPKALFHLERLLRAEERWSVLASLYEQRVGQTQVKEEKLALLAALGDLQRDRVGRADSASDTYRKILALDPANARALRGLAGLAHDEASQTALVRAYEAALKSRPRGDAELALLLDLGQLTWRGMGNAAAAEPTFARVRKVDPAQPQMLDFYRAYHGERNEAPKLLLVLQQAQKAVADEGRRLALAIEMAEVAESSPATAEKAIDIWKSVLKLDRTHAGAVAALKRLYQRTEKWNALLELLKEQAEALPKDAEHLDERIERLLEVVAIYRDRLRLDVMVINTYNTILGLKPDHEDALAQLAAKYESMGRWNDLIGVLQRQADASLHDADRARLLRRIAALWVEKFNNQNQAVKPLEELYALVPGDAEVAGKLREIYGKRRAWRSLLDLERKEVEALSGPPRRQKLVEMAKLAAERLGDAHEAMALWNRLLEADQDDAEALGALAALYERDKRYPALIEIYQRQRARTDEPKQALPLLEKIGALWADRLGSTENAIAAYSQILRVAPGHPKTVRVLRELFAQTGDFARLEALYADAGQYEELCEALLSVAERVDDPEQKLQLYRRVATVARDKLRQPERAAKAYERILVVDEHDLDAAQALVPIYRRGEKWARLLTVYEIVLGHASNEEDRLSVLREIRALCEDKLGSRQLAFTWAARAFALRPDDPALEHDLERLAHEADAHEELAAIYAGEVARLDEGERKIGRLRQLADLHFQRLGNHDEARRRYHEVLSRVPGDAHALSALEKIETAAGDFTALLDVYRRRIAATAPGEAGKKERIELLFKVAFAEEEKGVRPEEAVATYRAILDEDPASLRALQALERLHEGTGDFAALAGIHERQLALVGGDVDAEVTLAHKLGALQEQKLARPDLALVQYRRAFALRPSHRPTVSALERYLAAGTPSRVEVARLLAPVYQQGDDTARLVGVLEIVLDSVTGPSNEGDALARKEELELLRQLATLAARRLGDAEAAYRYAARIFDRLPGDAAVRAELRELADLLDNHADLVQRLSVAEQRAAVASDLALATEIAWELGQLHEDRLRALDAAEADYRRVLDHDATHEGAFLALERLYRGGERFVELRDLLLRKKALAKSDAVRKELLLQICELDEGVLEDDSAAVASYLEVLEIEAGSVRAMRALERIYAAHERYAELDALYAAAIRHATSAGERAQLIFRRGDLHATRLDDVTGAADLFEEALAEDPKSEGARKGLERLLTRPELRQRIARTLEPLYLADEAWPKLVHALQAQRERAEGREAVELLSRIARLVEEKLGSRLQALAVWREALLLDPADVETRDQVERIASTLGKYDELADAWIAAEKRADPNDLALRALLLRSAATLHDEQLGDHTRAIPTWQKLLDLDPTNLEIARPAAEALERLYHAQEAWPELIGILRRQAEWSDQVDDKKDFLRRLGMIQEDLTQEYDAAVRTHREILELDPEDKGGLDALERLHSAQDQWADLVGVLRRRVSLAADPAARRDLLWRIAELTEEKLLPLHQATAGDVIAAHAALLDEQPEDVPALEALGRLYKDADRAADLHDVLERRLLLEQGRKERVALRGRIAALLEGPLGHPEQALDRYREMLVDEPDDESARAGLERMLSSDELRLRAAEVLEPIYESRGDGEKLVHLHELWAEHAPDVRDRIARLRRIASQRQREGAQKDAFSALSRAARLAVAEPELPELLHGLDEASGKGDLKSELVALYRDLGPEILDAAVQERVYLTVAAVSRAMGDRPTAREYFRRVLDASPEHRRALDELESLYRESGEHEALLEIYNRRSELAGADDEGRRHYLALAAKLCETDLGRPGEAMSCYEQILALFPADDEAAHALERLYAQSGRHADLADLLERRLGFADDTASAVALHLRLGDLYGKQLQDADRAVENYRSALGGDPDHAPSIAALESYLTDPHHRVEAAEVLEPVYAARHDWRALIRIYEIRLDAADDPTRRLALTKRIARAYEEQLEDLEAAFRWYGKVFREDPNDRLIRDQLGRLAGILDCQADLAAIYQAWLDDTYDDTPAALDVTRLLASIYDARLNDVDRARACYQRLLRAHPDDAQAFQLLESALHRGSKWKDLLEVYREAADAAADPARRKTILFKICHIQEHALEDTDAAIDAYRAVLDTDGEDKRAIAALDRLYLGQRRWNDLVDLLSRQIDDADSQQRLALKLRLGGIQEKELGDVGAAIDAYEEVLRDDPHKREAVSALERLILDHDHRYRIAQILEPLYKAEDEWAKLVVIYDAQLEFIEDKDRRVALLEEIARLHAERGGHRDMAMKALSRAWTEEAPEGEEREARLYEKLYQTAAALAAWPKLVQVLEHAVEGSYDHDLVARVYARVAEIQEARQKDLPAAIESWRKVASVREDDEVAWRALERLVGALNRPAELVTILEKRGELSQDLGEQKALAYRAAELYERTLDKPDAAVATWRRVLDLDENDRPALGALGRLYEARGAHRELAAIYQRQIDLASSEEERRPLRFALARLHETELGDAFEAIGAYRAALEAQPDDLEALVAVARLYNQEGQWPDLVEALDAMAALKGEGAERDEVRGVAAKVVEEKQNDPEAAIRRYAEILDGSPDNEPSRAALEHLVEQEETREAAAAVLEPLYRARGDHQPLVHVLELRLQGESEAGARRTLLAQIADLHEIGLGEPRGAFAAWARLLSEEPSDGEAYAQIERITDERAAAGDGAAWEELGAHYETLARDAFDPEVQRMLHGKLGALYEERLGDDARAVAAWRKALELPGDEAGPLAALDRLLARSGTPRELAEVIEREAQAVQDLDAQAELLFRLGELRRGPLRDPDAAITAYRDALERAPHHAGTRAALGAMVASPAHAETALDLLEPLYELEGDHRKRADLAEARLGLLSDPRRRAEQLAHIARIEEEELHDRGAALGTLVRALGETPEESGVADEIERVAAPDQLAAAASAFERVLDGAGLPDETMKDLGLRAARIHEHTGDLPRAVVRYLAVLERDAEHPEALEALERIYRGGAGHAAEPDKLVAVLERRAELELDQDARKARYGEIAELRQEHLGDEAGAVAAWEKVLAVDETDGRALDQLAALHEAAGRHRALVEVLERQVRYGGGGGGAGGSRDEVGLKARIAEIYADRLRDADKAIEAFRDLLDTAPDHEGALDRLVELYAAQKRWSDVQDVLVQKLGVVGSQPDAPVRQAAIYRQLARLASEQQNAPEEAIAHLQQILDLDPGDVDAAAELERILASLGKWYDLVDVLRRHADRRAAEGDREGEIALLVRAADVYEQELQSPESATEILETLLLRDPANVRALGSLAKIYEASHDVERARSTLERAAALATSGAERAEIQFRLGRLAEEQEGEAAAEPYYRAALVADPHHAAAAEALERAARGREDWAEVARLLAARVERERGEGQKALLVELGKIHADRLGQRAAAIPLYERARALAPEDAAVLETLADAYFAEGRMKEALPVYRGLVEQVTRAAKGRRTKELARLHFRLGAIAEQEGNGALAAEQYQAAYAIDAAHPPTLSALGRLYTEQKEWEKARRIYRSMLLQNIDPASGVSKADVYLALGEIHEQLAEGPKAIGMYERGLEVDGAHPRLKAALARLRPGR